MTIDMKTEARTIGHPSTMEFTYSYKASVFTFSSKAFLYSAAFSFKESKNTEEGKQILFKNFLVS